MMKKVILTISLLVAGTTFVVAQSQPKAGTQQKSTVKNTEKQVASKKGEPKLAVSEKIVSNGSISTKGTPELKSVSGVKPEEQ